MYTHRISIFIVAEFIVLQNAPELLRRPGAGPFSAFLQRALKADRLREAARTSRRLRDILWLSQRISALLMRDIGNRIRLAHWDVSSFAGDSFGYSCEVINFTSRYGIALCPNIATVSNVDDVNEFDNKTRRTSTG